MGMLIVFRPRTRAAHAARARAGALSLTELCHAVVPGGEPL